MRDDFTDEPVDVRVDQQCGPYIMIGAEEVARVEELLRQNGVRYSLENGPNACKGAPEASVVDFGKGADPKNIQHVLDSVQ